MWALASQRYFEALFWDGQSPLTGLTEADISENSLPIGRQLAAVDPASDAVSVHSEAVNHGVSGDTSAGGVSRLDWALTGDVRVLVIELGANEGLRGLPVESTKANLSDIITRAKARGVAVLLTGMEAPPNHGPVYTAQFRQAFADLAREHKVAFVPFYLEGVAGNPALNISDGIHPNAEGAAIVEKTVWKALEPLLEQDRLKQVRLKADTTSDQ